jgi:putative transposase
MSGTRVVNKSDVFNENRWILEPLEARVKGMVVDILEGVKTNLEQELKGVALDVMRAVMEYEVATIVGPKGKHLKGRAYSRWGSNPGSVIIDGTKVRSAIPRVVEQESRTSYSLESPRRFHQVGELVRRAYRDLIRGISTRRYSEGIEAFLTGHGISASTVSRRMVRATSEKVEELFTRSIAELDLAVLMIDGVDIGGHTVVVVLGIDTTGKKRILGLRQGATENTVVVKGLLEDLVERGLRIERPMLVVIDGAKALRKAVSDVLGKATPVQRCTVHKKRNVLEHLAKSDRPWVSRRMTQAYKSHDVNAARRDLLRLAEELRPINPSAARSLEEGLEETLTVQRLALPEQLRMSLRSTNIIESANNGVRDRTRNVKRWRDGLQRERWAAAGLLETEKNFRRIKGCAHMAVLITALENYQAQEKAAA